MSFSILTPTGDRDTLSTGILFLAIWAYWLGMSLYFPRRRAKWLKKNPSFPDLIGNTFNRFSEKSFSSLGMITYAAWFCLGVSMIAMGYVSEPSRAVKVRLFMLCMVPVTLLATGLHFYLNAQFLNIAPVMNTAAKNYYNIEPLRTLDQKDGWVFQVLGLAMVGVALFLLSCGVFKFPMDLSMLATLVQKFDQE